MATRLPRSPSTTTASTAVAVAKDARSKGRIMTASNHVSTPPTMPSPSAYLSATMPGPSRSDSFSIASRPSSAMSMQSITSSMVFGAAKKPQSRKTWTPSGRQSHTMTRQRERAVRIVLPPAPDGPSTSARLPPRSISLTPRRRAAEIDSGLPPTFVPGFHDESAVRATDYRRLGETDMIVSKVGLGASAFAGLFGNVSESITQIVDRALRHGVNHIDAAYWYARQRSEHMLARALQRIPRRAYYLSSSVGRFELDFVRSFDYRGDRCLEMLMDALKRMHTTYLDVCYVQIHDADFGPNQSIILNETLPALEMARRAGKIRYIGLAGYSLAKLAYDQQSIEIGGCNLISATLAASSVRIDVVQTYARTTLADNSLGEWINFFRDYSVAVVVGAPLGMGILSGNPDTPPGWHPAGPTIREAARLARDYCCEKRLRLSRLALDYAINFAGTHACLVGCKSVDEVDEALKVAVEGLTPVEVRVRERLLRRFFDPLANAHWEGIAVDEYWARLKRLGLSSLATRRHPSVESLASTLNGTAFFSAPSERDTNGARF